MEVVAILRDEKKFENRRTSNFLGFDEFEFLSDMEIVSVLDSESVVRNGMGNGNENGIVNGNEHRNGNGDINRNGDRNGDGNGNGNGYGNESERIENKHGNLYGHGNGDRNEIENEIGSRNGKGLRSEREMGIRKLRNFDGDEKLEDILYSGDSKTDLQEQ